MHLKIFLANIEIFYKKRIVERNPEIKRLRNEIDIITTSLNDNGTQTYSERETDYTKLLLDRKLELAYWENLNSKNLLSDLNQLNKNIVNKPIHLIADKKIIKNPTKNKRNLVLSFSIAVALSLFILLIDIESKKRRT